MNIRLRKVDGDGLFVEEFILRKAKQHNLKVSVRQWGRSKSITIDGNYPFDLDAELRHPGFIRDSRIESILDFLDDDFDNDKDDTE
jgi:hypothetical protein